MFNVFQIIKEPTKISTNSSSTIDLILVSDEDKISQTGVLQLGISDHSLIYCTRRVVKAAINKHNTVKLRSMKNYDKDTVYAVIFAGSNFRGFGPKYAH